MSSNLFYGIKIHNYTTTLFIVHGLQIDNVNSPAKLGTGSLKLVRDLEIITKWYLEVIFIIKRQPMHDTMGDIIGLNPALKREPIQTFDLNDSKFLNHELEYNSEW